MKPLALNLLCSCLVTCAALTAYHYKLARSAPPAATVNVAQVFEERQALLAQRVIAAPSEEERRAIIETEAKRFVTDVTTAMEELATECRCLVLDKSVLVGADAKTPDLTDELRERVKQ